MILYQLALRVAVPIAARWIARQQERILAGGEPLTGAEMLAAQAIGIRHPEQVRLLRVSEVPLPLHRISTVVAPLVGMLGSRTAGLTAGYGIFIRSDHWGDQSLVAHELAHIRQYEEFGGIRPFLEQYLSECLFFGYAQAPLERDAAERASALLSQVV